MGRLIDADKAIIDYAHYGISHPYDAYDLEDILTECPTVEAIPKDNVYNALQEMMNYEHEGFINISLARLDEILKKCGVSEDGKID